MTDPVRLGIIGGTFDPIHLGHLGIAEAARSKFALDRVIFVPAAAPPHKGGRSIAPAADRLAMISLAIAGKPYFAASDIEMRREGPSYTIDTLDEFSALNPDAKIFFIVGADSLLELHQWHHAKELASRYDFIIVGRPGSPLPSAEQLAAHFGQKAAEKLCSGILTVEPYDVSATEIRRRVAEGKNLSRLVTDEVAGYIIDKGLYARGEA